MERSLWGRLRDASIDKASASHACFAYFMRMQMTPGSRSFDTWLAPVSYSYAKRLAASRECVAASVAH